ncbi:MAG: T9SS type A sorting domain-containing protein, partial [Saprospiraceae bacterium]
MKLFIIISIILFSLPLQSQRLIQRFDPNLHTNFEASHVLQNNSHRFYCTARKSNYESHIQPNIIDWNVEELTMQTWFAEDVKFGYPLLSGAFKLFLIALPNNDAIVVANTFNCDFGGTDIVYVTSDQQTKWYLPGQDLNPYPYEIDEIGLVGKDVVALIMEGEETLYIDFDGIRRTYDVEPDIYTHMLYQDQSIYGYRDHHWYQLDTAFQELHSIELDTITFIWALGHHLLLQTNEALILVDDSLNVLYENVDLQNIHGACSIDTGICIISDDKLYFLDSTLQVIKQYASLEHEKIQYVASSGDTVFAWSEYDGLRHTDFVIREYLVNETPSVPLLDLSFNSLILPEAVINYHYQWWNNQLNFDTIYLDITNNSSDTINKFRVECDWAPIAVVMCTDYQKTWNLDQLLFLPGETRIFKLLPFKVDSITYGYHSPFCFWIESPNDLPDPDPTNNYACDDTQLVSGSKEVAADSDLLIYPNPCDQGVFIDIGDNEVGKLTVELLSIEGRHLDQNNLDKSNWISLENYHSGFYVLRIMDKTGRSCSEKI